MSEDKNTNNLKSAIKSSIDNPLNLPKNYAEPLTKLFKDNEIRIVFDDSNKPWFVLADVLNALGSSTRPADAKTAIFQGLGKGVVNDYPLQTNGGKQVLICIAKPAVTYLVDRSNTDIGKQLRKFIHFELLPELEKDKPKNGLVLTPELEVVLSNIFNSFFEMQKQQNENQLKVIKALSDQVAELQKTVNQLTDRNHKLIDLNKIYFTVHEVLEHVNKHYKIQNKTGVFTLNDFRVFLLHDVRMIKGSYNPYAKYVNNNYVTHSLKFTEIGIKFVIDEMHKHGLI